jgi:hypothetical protein
VATSSGTPATLYERERPIPYARFISVAAVPASPSQIASTVVDPQFAIDRVVLLESAPGIVPGAVPDPLPPPSGVTVEVAEWRPGGMRLRLGTAAPNAGHLLVSENWDAEWRASVDGKDAPVLRGDGTLITVPVPAGARKVTLRYEGRSYARGRAITTVALLVLVIGLALPPVMRRRRTA